MWRKALPSATTTPGAIMTYAERKPRLLLVGDEAFEKLIARANEIGEEMWRRYLFNNPGAFDNLPAWLVDKIRDNCVYRIAGQYCERVARRANEYFDAEEQRQERKRLREERKRARVIARTFPDKD
jgi:hypothetical protein